MIKFYVAPPGSGKTYTLVQRETCQALKRGWNVFHNIRGLNAVKLAYYCELFPSDVENQLEYMYTLYIERFISDRKLQTELDKFGIEKMEQKYSKELVPVFRDSVPDILERIVKLPKHTLIILDEAQNFIPATDFKEQKNIKFFEYATTHRHHGHELVLATQHEDNVDVKLRRIANLLIYMYRRDILGFLFKNSVTERHYAGCATGNPELLNKYVIRFDKRVFSLYKSYVEDDIVEHRKYRSIWFNGLLIFLVIVFLLCLTRVPKFLRQWGVIGKPKKLSEKVLDTSYLPEYKTASDYLGNFKDYYCGNKLYILRWDDSIEFWEVDLAPEIVCPKKNHSPNEVKK